jgi:hypothetical protein
MGPRVMYNLDPPEWKPLLRVYVRFYVQQSIKKLKLMGGCEWFQIATGLEILPSVNF